MSINLKFNLTQTHTHFRNIFRSMKSLLKFVNMIVKTLKIFKRRRHSHFIICFGDNEPELKWIVYQKLRMIHNLWHKPNPDIYVYSMSKKGLLRTLDHLLLSGLLFCSGFFNIYKLLYSSVYQVPECLQYPNQEEPHPQRSFS